MSRRFAHGALAPAALILNLALWLAHAEVPAAGSTDSSGGKPASEQAPAISASVLAAQKKSFDAAVARLGADDFVAREKASNEIVALGPVVLPWVNAAFEANSDVEIKSRLAAIVTLLKREPVLLAIRAADPGGKDLTFSWKQVQGPDVKIGDPSAGRREDEKDGKDEKWVSSTYFVPAQSGQYVFEVSVRNSDGEVSRTLVSRDVTVARAALVKVPENLAIAVGREVRIDAVPADANARLAYSWTCVEPEDLKIPEKLASNASLIFAPKVAREYVFKVSVTDSEGHSESAQCKLTVRP